MTEPEFLALAGHQVQSVKSEAVLTKGEESGTALCMALVHYIQLLTHLSRSLKC